MNILEYENYQEKNLPWKPFISIYHLPVLDPTGFFLCADPLA